MFRGLLWGANSHHNSNQLGHRKQQWGEFEENFGENFRGENFPKFSSPQNRSLNNSSSRPVRSWYYHVIKLPIVYLSWCISSVRRIRGRILRRILGRIFRGRIFKNSPPQNRSLSHSDSNARIQRTVRPWCYHVMKLSNVFIFRDGFLGEFWGRILGRIFRGRIFENPRPLKNDHWITAVATPSETMVLSCPDGFLGEFLRGILGRIFRRILGENFQKFSPSKSSIDWQR